MKKKLDKKKYVYCAGALFCPSDVKCMAKISTALENAGYGTFLPHRDGLEAYLLGGINNIFLNSRIFKPFNRFFHKAIFVLDIYQIVERCDYFIFNFNGRIADEGGVVETGVAFASGKPVIIYKDDYRRMLGSMDNPKLYGGSFSYSVVSSVDTMIEELAALDKKAITAKDYDTIHNHKYPFNVKKVIKFGRRVWKALLIVHFFRKIIFILMGKINEKNPVNSLFPFVNKS